MDDQSEKIVFLAREILNAGVDPVVEAMTSPKKAIRFTMSFKTLCFTTLLAAAGGSVAATVMHEDTRPLNRYERTEIDALLFYAAKINNTDADILRHEVEKKIGVTCLDNLTASEFPAARRYLQDKAQ